MSDNIELKPCPFCGHKSPSMRYGCDAKTRNVCWVVCGNYNCFATIEKPYYSEEEAVAAWNRRAGEEAK